MLLGVAIAGVGVGSIVFLTRAQLNSDHTTHAAPSRATTTPIPVAARATYVPWAALPASGRSIRLAPDLSPSPPVPVPQGTPACRADQLDGGGYEGGGLTGGVVIKVVHLRNRTSAPCTLHGFPELVVLDARGATLAKAIALGEPSMVPSAPSVAFLLLPGAPPLPRSGGPAAGWTTPGEALLDFDWIDCRQPRASTLELYLPDGGGRLLVDFPLVASKSAGCYGEPPEPAGPALGGGPFVPSGVEWPPPPKYLSVDATLTLPTLAQRGTTLVYYVTLSNNGAVDYTLDECPDYNEFVGAKAAVAAYQLNCAAAHDIPPGGSRTFQMQLALPASVPLGATTLVWALGDGRIAQSVVSAAITVTG